MNFILIKPSKKKSWRSPNSDFDLAQLPRPFIHSTANRHEKTGSLISSGEERCVSRKLVTVASMITEEQKREGMIKEKTGLEVS